MTHHSDTDAFDDLRHVAGLALSRAGKTGPVREGLQRRIERLETELGEAERLRSRNAFLEEVVVAERKERLGCTDEEARDLGVYLRNQNAPAAFRKPAQIITDALRAELVALLPRLTDKQRASFDKLFQGGVAERSDDNLKMAIGLCQRTISKNERGETNENG